MYKHTYYSSLGAHPSTTFAARYRQSKEFGNLGVARGNLASPPLPPTHGVSGVPLVPGALPPVPRKVRTYRDFAPHGAMTHSDRTVERALKDVTYFTTLLDATCIPSESRAAHLVTEVLYATIPTRLDVGMLPWVDVLTDHKSETWNKTGEAILNTCQSKWLSSAAAAETPDPVPYIHALRAVAARGVERAATIAKSLAGLACKEKVDPYFDIEWLKALAVYPHAHVQEAAVNAVLNKVFPPLLKRLRDQSTAEALFFVDLVEQAHVEQPNAKLREAALATLIETVMPALEEAHADPESSPIRAAAVQALAPYRGLKEMPRVLDNDHADVVVDGHDGDDFVLI